MLDISRFALNRIIYPTLDLDGFFKFSTELGINKVELRNDLPGGKILDMDMQPMRYNTKRSLLNPHFLVIGDPQFDWAQYF